MSARDDGTIIRLLDVGEGHVLGDAIRVAYGDSYDAAWVYDAAEVDQRIADGRVVSCVAETPDGAVLCHAALTRSTAAERVAEAGQAVTLPAARGHHLFTAVKAHLAEWARGAGLFGMFSEATTAHPFSQKANVDLGAQETGFLLGWIPATVSNDAALGDRASRQSAAVFYLKTNDGHLRPVFAPRRHRDVIGAIIDTCGLRGSLADAPLGAAPPDASVVHLDVRADHNLAVLSIEVPGADLTGRVRDARARAFADGLDAVYVDLPLDHPATEVAAEELEDLGVTFAGVFPNSRVAGDVLRLQSLNGVELAYDDIATASDHGRDLLAYVLADQRRVEG